MTLKITRSSDPIEIKTITTCLYALPGIGRTSTGFTAADPILFDFDRGAYRSKNRRTSVHVDTWDDVQGVKDEDLVQYKTAVIDTVGRALDLISVKLIASDPKNGNGAGGLSLKGYGALKRTFVGWMNRVRSLGLDVVLLAHMDEQRNGETLIERLDIQGSSKNEVYKVSDAMGRIYLQDGKRVLSFSPTDVSFGKNPGSFPLIDIPHFSKEPNFLAGVIQQTKDALNELSEEQREVGAMLADWQIKVSEAATPEDFDKLRNEGREADPRVKPLLPGMLGKAAKDRGLTFNKEADKFEGPAPAPSNVVAMEQGKRGKETERQPGQEG